LNSLQEVVLVKSLFLSILITSSIQAWIIAPDVVTDQANINTAYLDSFAMPVPVVVKFTTIMEYEILMGKFHPGTDTLSVRGDFNNWSDTDIMHICPGDPNYYEFTDTFYVNYNDTWNFRFVYRTPDTLVWEDLPNRIHTFSMDDINGKSTYIDRIFNDLSDDKITHHDLTIAFKVNMNNAINALTGSKFSDIKNVFLCGGLPPLEMPDEGWPDSEKNKVMFLNDEGFNGDNFAGDGIWSINILFKKYSLVDLYFKYGANWGLPENGGSNDNESKSGDFHYLWLLPWGLTQETYSSFGRMEITDAAYSIEESADFYLEQNYPNPFNPSTTITFSIPENSFTTLIVYDILGREVASLLNEEKTPGTYELKFDASDLPSGTYIYRLTAGKYTSCRKLILLK